MQLKQLAAVACAAAISSSACSTPTTISGVWRDPDFSGAPLRKVFVIARTSDENNRRALEEALAAALARHDVQSATSYRVFHDPHPAREAVRQYLEAQGFDGALVAALKGVLARTTVETGGSFEDYYGVLWGPSYYSPTDQIVDVETTLWNPHDGKLIWSATSETANPTSSSDAISSMVSKIVATLTEARLIPPERAVAYAAPALAH
jgi:hypothetical protein